jgi:hypothetical protein
VAAHVDQNVLGLRLAGGAGPGSPEGSVADQIRHPVPHLFLPDEPDQGRLEPLGHARHVCRVDGIMAGRTAGTADRRRIWRE